MQVRGASRLVRSFHVAAALLAAAAPSVAGELWRRGAVEGLQLRGAGAVEGAYKSGSHIGFSASWHPPLRAGDEREGVRRWAEAEEARRRTESEKEHLAVEEEQDGGDDDAVAREQQANDQVSEKHKFGTQLTLQAKKKKKPEWDKSEKERGHDFKEEWYTFWYWKPVLCTTSYILFIVDVLFPLLIDKFWEFSMWREILLFTVTAYGAAAVSFGTLNPKAAGVTYMMVGVAMMCTFALAVLAGVGTLYLRHPNPKSPAILLTTDTTLVFRPLLNTLAVVIICQVFIAESGVDWSDLATVISFAMFGIVLAVTGVIGDIFAHVFIRLDENFREGDFLIFEGELVEIESFGWRHTVAVRDTECARIYIPNSMLTSCSVVNQSKDSDREITVEVPVKLTSEKLEQAIQNIHGLLQRTAEEGYTFEGPDGEVYDNQLNTDECRVYLSPTCDKIIINLVGAYYFSNPPPFEDEGPEPPLRERQMDWEMQWYYQVQWFHLEVKEMNEKLGQWPYVNNNQLLLKYGMPPAE